MRITQLWRERSLTCLNAAKLLLDSGLYEDSISRSYYAAYCAASSVLVEHGVTFAHGWNNPSHEQLPDLISNNTSLPREKKRRINRALRLLRQAREDADYRPHVRSDRTLAIGSIHSALDVLQLLEIRDG